MYLKLKKLLDLPFQQQEVLCGALLLLPLFALLVRALGFGRFRHWLDERTTLPMAVVTAQEISAIACAVNMAARLGPFKASCLTRSMVLKWLLRNRGVGTSLRVGVRTDSGMLDAHAWVEYQGVPINDRIDIGDHYAAFDTALTLSAFSKDQ